MHCSDYRFIVDKCHCYNMLYYLLLQFNRQVRACVCVLNEMNENVARSYLRFIGKFKRIAFADEAPFCQVIEILR